MMNEQPSCTSNGKAVQGPKRAESFEKVSHTEGKMKTISNSLSIEKCKASLKHVSMDDKTENSVLSIDEELHQAALRVLRRAKEEKIRQDAVPLHEKVAMLNEEFRNVRDIRGEETDGASYGFSANEDQASEFQQSVDYSDCVRTLSDPEFCLLQSSLQNSEKERFNSLVRSLSDQLAEFHQLLDEHERAKSEIIKLRKVCEARNRQDKEKELRMADLEQDVIAMKLAVAQYKSNEDYQRLTIARLEMENKQLKSELDKKSPKEEGDGTGSPKGHQRNHSELTQSLTLDNSDRNNIRAGEAPLRKNNLLTQSCRWVASASGWNANLASEKNEPIQVQGRPKRINSRRESTPDIPTTNTTWKWSITNQRAQRNNSDPMIIKRHARSQSVTVPSQHANPPLLRKLSDGIPRAAMEKDLNPGLEETRRTFKQQVKSATQNWGSNLNANIFNSASDRQWGGLKVHSNKNIRANDSWEVEDDSNLNELKRSNPNCAPQDPGLPYVSSGGSLSSITFDIDFFHLPTKEMQREFSLRQPGQGCGLQLRRGNSVESGLSLSYC